MSQKNRFAFFLLLVFFAGGTSNALASDTKRQTSKRRTKVELEGVININTATPEQLMMLPGIGPSTVRLIIRHRQIEKFELRYHIMWVKGIGKKTYRKLKPYLTVSGETTLQRRKVKIPTQTEQATSPPLGQQPRPES